METGGQCVMMDGPHLMQTLPVDSWDSQIQVGLSMICL